MKKLFFLISLFPILYSLFPPRASAVNIPTAFNSPKLTSVGGLVSLLLPNAIAGAAVIFFAMILFGGFQMVRSAGGSPSPQEAAKAKAAITYGIIGFLLVVTAYSILQIIKLITGIDFLNLSLT